MTASNLVFLFSDQHSRPITGCYGHRFVKTPNLDRLAHSGTLFHNSYCNAPVCVPSRASMATGRYVHDIGTWDNCTPYSGDIPSWGHRLQAAGYHVASIGKLHFRSSDDDNGFDEEILPMHIIDGTGPLRDIIRDPVPESDAFPIMVRNAGCGDSPYIEYDRKITSAALSWLANDAPRRDTKPWALFISWVSPHPPYIAPREFFQAYPLDEVPWPSHYGPDERISHPAFEDFRQCFGTRGGFSEDTVRRLIAAYYGLVSYLDSNIGRVLGALRDRGALERTQIIYTSDHGDSLGDKYMFSKCNMLETSVGVPLILAGPDAPKGREVDTPVQLVDIFPTIVEGAGLPVHEQDRDLPGHSLYGIATGEKPDRLILAEQHSAGAKSATFMIRKGAFKYIHYVDYAPQLFNLDVDPDESCDLASKPDHAATLRDCEAALRALLDPRVADKRAKTSQAQKIADAGGPEAVLALGSTGFSPPPGQETVYYTSQDSGANTNIEADRI